MRSFNLPFTRRKPTVAVVHLSGVIAAGARTGLSYRSCAPLLERAFKARRVQAVALVLNSPGGSPVQSSLIGAAIRRLADETGLTVHAFVEDVAASGGYWLAAAADQIWVDESSITGSIGVVSAGFGFVDALDKLGVERRVHTAGEDKSMLDPFRPERATDIERLKRVQKRIHETFIAHVKARRGSRLDEARDLFTGEIFVGQEAVDTGLADGVAHLVPKMKDLLGEDVRFRSFAQRKPWATRFLPGASAALSRGALDALEERALETKFELR